MGKLVMARHFNRSIKILLWTNGLILFAGAMLAPIYALFVEDLGGDLLDVSLLYAAYAVVGGLVTVVSGYYADHVKENEYIVIFGYTLMGLAFLGLLLASSVWHLFFIQIVIAIGSATYGPAFDSLYSKHLDKGQAGTEWGLWEGMSYFVSAVAAVAGGFLVTSFSFSAMFIAMAALSFISAGYLLMLPRKVL